MADGGALQFSSIGFRHQLPNPKWYNPFNKRQGAGIAKLDLTLHEGQIIGLVGTNGAGKTTLLRMISGILPLHEGHISKDDKRLDVDSLRSMVGFMPEQIRWSGQHSIRETMLEFALLQGCSIQSTEEILSIVGLRNWADSSLESLSQGMRQRLSLAVALLGTPKVLVLDEPFNGMDPVAIDAFKRLLRTLANNGIAVVISSHHLSELDHLVDTIALLHRGQLLGHGAIESLQAKLGFEEMTEVVLDQEITDSIIDSLNIFEHTATGQEHRYIFDSSHPELLATLIERGYEISTWRIIPPTLIELLCAATGLDRDAIGMDVGHSNMIPLRTLGGEEE